AAIDDGRNLHARILAPDVQSAYTLGPVNLVRSDRHQVDVVFINVNGDFADGLNTVGVEKHSALATDLADLAPGLQDADFIIGGHDGDENGLVIDGALQVVEVDESVLLHRQIGHAIAVLLKPLTGIEHCLVLGDRGDDVVALFTVHFGDTFY